MSEPVDRARKFARPRHAEADKALSSARQGYDLKTEATLLDIEKFASWAAVVVAGGRPAYDSDVTRRLAGEAIISRLGEAVTRISDQFKADHPGVPWRAIRNTRNLGAHEYDLVDHDANWQMLATGIPMIAEKLGLR